MVTDLKTKRLAGIKNDTFEGLLKAADIPAKYYCRRSFATWDVLLPSEDLAAKLAGENVISKYFRLQPEYMGGRGESEGDLGESGKSERCAGVF